MSFTDLPTHRLLKRARSLREMAREAEDERTRKAILQVAQEYEAEASGRSRNPERRVAKDAAD
jgi:hypothetical protein